MSSAICLNLDHYKILLSGNGLMYKDLCNGKQLFPLKYYPAKLVIIKNEYYCTTFTDSFFKFFSSLNGHL